MAVELRCPDCRAKLRLQEQPEPGTEIECPECNAVFTAPDLDTGEVPDARGKPKAADSKPKPRPSDDDEDQPKKHGDGGKARDVDFDPNAPRKRRAKKKETNRAALTFIIIAGV